MERVDRVNIQLNRKGQLMAEVRRHLGLNPTPHQNRVTVPDVLDRFNHSRAKQRKPTVHSFVAGRNVHQRDSSFDQAEPNPFSAQTEKIGMKRATVLRPQPPSVKQCMVELLCTKPCICQNDKRQCVNEPTPNSSNRFGDDGNTINGCQVNKQLERLQVQNYPLPPSILDHQLDYFTGVKGRPLKENFKRSEFNKSKRTVFFKTIMSSFIKDDLCRRGEQHKLDMGELEAISQELDLVGKTFQKFVESSNQDSVALVQDQLRAGHQSEDVQGKLAAHKGILSKIKSDILKCESHLSSLLLCRDLLLKLSPPAWRMKYENDAAQFAIKWQWLHQLSASYDDYCRYHPEPGRDFFLDEAMELFLKAVHTMGPPRIYFTDSWQISMVLREKELNCVNQIGDIVELERKISEIDDLSKALTRYRAVEMKKVLEQTDKGRAEFDHQKKRVAELEADAQKLIPKYVDTIFSGDIALETAALVEVLYADIIGKSKQTPELIRMMIEIDAAFQRQKNQLREIQPEILRRCEKKVEVEERKKYKAAARAKSVYREVRMIVKRARNTYMPPPKGPRPWKIPVRRSTVPPLKKKKSRNDRGDNTCQHYQLKGILSNEEMEKSLEKAIAAYCGRSWGASSVSEDSAGDGTSVMSCASTESIERAVDDRNGTRRLTSGPSEGERDDLAVIEMGYDSDEHLIKQNYDKKRGLVEKPQVLYDAKMLDDRFMVEADDVKFTERDRRHVRRYQTRTHKNNPLSWR